MANKQSIRAVHDNYLTDLLNALALSEKLEAGLLKCMICEDVVTFESLQALVPKGNYIGVVCDKIQCYEQAIAPFEESGK